MLVRNLERLRNIVLGVSFFKRDSPGRSFVIAFRNMEEVHAYVPPQFIARAWSARNPLAQPVVVLSTASLEDDRRIVTHELTHTIAFNVIPDQPAWFAEGLAGYFETVRLDDDRGKVEVGRPVDWRFRQLRSEGLTPVAQLFACEQVACKDDRFYATTWAVVTYLINKHPDDLMRYMQRLIETPGDQQAKLWAEVFPALPPATLDREVAQWLAYGRIQINQYNAVFDDPTPTVRPLADADVFAARGLMRYFNSRDGVPEEITQALALDPTAVLPNVIAATATKSITPDKAHAIAAAHPDDWRAWWLVGWASTSGESARAARIKMCALLEKNPAALPPQACAPAALDPAKDPRNIVFRAAIPQINACFASTKTRPSAEAMALEMDISETGTVTRARATTASPALSACMEGVLRGLTFPAGMPGPFRIDSKQ